LEPVVAVYLVSVGKAENGAEAKSPTNTTNIDFVI
jgi:hypothetical protein